MTNSEILALHDASKVMISLAYVVMSTLQLDESPLFESGSEERHSLATLKGHLNCAIGHCAGLLQFPFEQEQNLPETENMLKSEAKSILADKIEQDRISDEKKEASAPVSTGESSAPCPCVTPSTESNSKIAGMHGKPNSVDSVKSGTTSPVSIDRTGPMN